MPVLNVTTSEALTISVSLGDAGEAARQAGIATAATARAQNAVPFDTWSDLAAATSMVAGDRATVLSGDTGTHTDPVVGGTVDNAGVYEYSSSPAGWERVGDLDSVLAAEQAATITAQADTIESLDALFADDPFNDLSISDENGYVIAVFENGEWVGPNTVASSSTSASLLYSVNFFPVNGQSLSVGQAKPAVSTTQAYDNLMFYRGMRPQYDYTSETATEWYASFVPAVEVQSPTETSLAETPATGAGDMVKQRILSEEGLAYTDHSYQLLLSTPGYGATTISGLSKGTTHYARMIEQVTYGKSLANAAGKTFGVPAVGWVQGESDYLSGTTKTGYRAQLDLLISNQNTDIKAASGQADDVYLITYQVCTHLQSGISNQVPNVALAQLDCALENPLCTMAGPIYHLDYQSLDNFHLDGVSSRLLGGYLGLAYHRRVRLREDWKPLHPTSSIVQGSIAEVTFDVPMGPLEWDTTPSYGAQTNYGFQLVDSAGSALTISSVTIIDVDRVRVVAASTIPAGAKLRYGWDGPGARGVGNLRDSQGDTITFTADGTAYPMHNWCVIFELEL